MSTYSRRTLLQGALAGTAAGSTASSKPRNIILILTDDHRYDAMGFLKGQPWLETPHLDSLGAPTGRTFRMRW